MMHCERIFIITGPSGVGKDTIIGRLEKELPVPFIRPLTVTTRSPRPGEIKGKDFRFVRWPEFKRMIGADEFIEHAFVHHWWFGTPKYQIEQAQQKDQCVIWRIDPITAVKVKKEMPEIVLIYIDFAPGDLKENIHQRLNHDPHRGSVSNEEIEARYATATKEDQVKNRFDYIVINYNDMIEETVKEIKNIIMSHLNHR